MPGGDIDCGTRADQLRQEVINAANRLLEASRSHDSLSLTAIARELGVPTMRVADYFPDKMSLGLAVYQQYFGVLTAQMGRRVAECVAPKARLRAVITTYLQFAVEYPDAYYVMFSLPGIAGPPDDVPLEERPGTALMMLVRDVLAECMEAGLIHDVDAYQGMLCLWSTLHGIVALRRNRPHVPWPPIEQMAETVLAAQLCPITADLAGHRGSLGAVGPGCS